MPLSIICSNPDCHISISVPDGFIGQKLKCRKCGTVQMTTVTSDSNQSPSKSSYDSTVQSISRFQLRKKLGAGAFGTVHQAYDPQLDRIVALKLPNPGVLTTPNRVERFLREAKSAAGLRHPNIVPVFDAGKSGDRYYIASAFIDGKKLSDTIPETGDDFTRCAKQVRQLAEALAYAHREGVIHRDVKPDNILVDHHDQLHLTDFGLASRQDEESRLTNEGAILGTPSYMAPEIAAGQNGEAQASVDQYAAGVVLYEMMTGRVPYEGPPAIILHNVIHTPAEAPSKIRKGVPRDLETICLKAMAKQPADRYPSCQELADDLRRWIDGEPISARRLSPVEQFTRWAKRNKTVAGLSLAVAVALIAGAIVSSTFAIQARLAATEAANNENRAKEEEAKAIEALGKVEEERKRVTAALTQADIERTRAESERKLAQQERDTAKKAQAETEIEKSKVQAEVERTKKALEAVEAAQARERVASYGSRIALARLQLEAKQPAQAIRSLDECAPEQRSFEWNWLRDWAEKGKQASAINDLTKKYLHSAAISTDGRWIAMNGSPGSLDPRSQNIVLIQTGNWTSSTILKMELGQLEPGSPLPERICGLCFSPNGNYLAAGTAQQFRVWSTETGKQVLHVQQQALPKLVSNGHLAFSSDSKYLAVAHKALGIWEIETGKKVLSLATPKTNQNLGSIAFVQKNQKVFDGSTMWDANTGLEIPNPSGAARPHSSMLLESNDGQWCAYIATYSDKFIYLGNQVDGTFSKLAGHVTDITSIAFSRDCKRLFSSSLDGIIKVWDLETKREIVDLPGGIAALAMQHESKTNSLLAISGTGQVVRWSLPQRNKQNVTSIPRRAVIKIIPLRSENRLVFISTFGVSVYDWENQNELASWQTESKRDTISDASLSPDRKKIAYVVKNSSDKRGYEADIFIADTMTGKLITKKTTNLGFERVTWSSAGKQLYLSGVGGNLSEWTVDPPKEPSVLIDRGSRLVEDPSPNKLIWTLVSNYTSLTTAMTLFDPSTRKFVEQIPGPQFLVAGLFTPTMNQNGTLICNLVFEKLFLFQVRTKRFQEIKIPKLPSVENLYVNPEGTWLAVGGRDETVTILHIATGKIVTQLTGLGQSISSIGLTPDGKFLMAGAANLIKLWPVEESWSKGMK
jgi:eukaryotic-like serine/threonine-protein kinase